MTVKTVLRHFLGIVLLLLAVPMALAFLFFNLNPMGLGFQTRFEVVNLSGEMIRITPMGWTESGRLRPLPRFLMSFPLVPAIRRGPFPLDPEGRFREVIVLPDADPEVVAAAKEYSRNDRVMIFYIPLLTPFVILLAHRLLWRPRKPTPA